MTDKDRLYSAEDFLRDDYSDDFIPAWPAMPHTLICKHCGKLISTGIITVSTHLIKECPNYDGFAKTLYKLLT